MRDAEAVEFQKRWVAKFKEQADVQKGPEQHNAWEGSSAYRELNETDNLWRLIPTAEHGAILPTGITDRLSREVQIYNVYKTSVVAVNKGFKIAIGALSSAESRLKKAKTPESKVKTEVDERIRQCISAVEETRRSLEWRRDIYWKDVLVADPQERMKGWVSSESQDDLDSIIPEERAEWEKIFEKGKYPPTLVKQTALDTRFQLRVGVILRFYLMTDFEVSLRTISRLVILTYILRRPWRGGRR